jgi:chemotaxis protein MotB
MSTAAKGKKEEPEKKPRRRIKKVAGHGGHHGGSWKVAYADFVTAMMALFLVLWLLSQADTKLKQSIANYFRSPGVFPTQEGTILEGPQQVGPEPTPLEEAEQAALSAIASTLKKKFATLPEFTSYKDRVKIDLTDEGLRIQIVDKADRVTFESGSAELNAAARAVLTEIAKAICELPNPIAIGGHTDKHLFPQGSSYTNWELSADRANVARRTLESNCVKPEQMRRVVGYADTELLYPNQPFAAANRRINITVLRLHKAPETSKDKKPEFVEKSATAKEPTEPAEKDTEKDPDKDEEKDAEKEEEKKVTGKEKAGTKPTKTVEESAAAARESAAEKPAAAKSKGAASSAKAKSSAH